MIKQIQKIENFEKLRWQFDRKCHSQLSVQNQSVQCFKLFA